MDPCSLTELIKETTGGNKMRKVGKSIVFFVLAGLLGCSAASKTTDSAPIVKPQEETQPWIKMVFPNGDSSPIVGILTSETPKPTLIFQGWYEDITVKRCPTAPKSENVRQLPKRKKVGCCWETFVTFNFEGCGGDPKNGREVDFYGAHKGDLEFTTFLGSLKIYKEF